MGAIKRLFFRERKNVSPSKNSANLQSALNTDLKIKKILDELITLEASRTAHPENINTIKTHFEKLKKVPGLISLLGTDLYYEIDTEINLIQIGKPSSIEMQLIETKKMLDKISTDIITKENMLKK